MPSPRAGKMADENIMEASSSRILPHIAPPQPSLSNPTPLYEKIQVENEERDESLQLAILFKQYQKMKETNKALRL